MSWDFLHLLKSFGTVRLYNYRTGTHWDCGQLRTFWVEFVSFSWLYVSWMLPTADTVKL